MKDYQVGDTMLVPLPFNVPNSKGELVEARILHIPQHPQQMWIFEFKGLRFGIHTGSQIIKYEEKTDGS